MIIKKNILCIVPARKNSIRLKNKNIKTFFKKPLIFWTLNFAIKINFISKIVLTSDSKEILNHGKFFKKIKMHRRSKKLALGSTLMEDVVMDVIEKEKNQYAGILILQPTTPFRDIKKFNFYTKQFLKTKKNYISVSQKIRSKYLCKMNKKKVYFVKKNGVNCYQDGSLILLNYKDFLKNKNLEVEGSTAVEMKNKFESFDIDYNKDFRKVLRFFKSNYKFREYFLNNNIVKKNEQKTH